MGMYDNCLYVLELNNEILNINVKKPKMDKPKQSYLWHVDLIISMRLE